MPSTNENEPELDIKPASVYITKLIETLSIRGVVFNSERFHNDTIGFLLKTVLGVGSNRLHVIYIAPIIAKHDLTAEQRYWGHIIDLYFPPVGRPRHYMFAALYDAGFTLKELIELENLCGRAIWDAAWPDMDEKDLEIVNKFLSGQEIEIEKKRIVTKWFGLVKSEVIEKEQIDLRNIPEYVVMYLKGWLKLKLEEEKTRKVTTIVRVSDENRALQI